MDTSKEYILMSEKAVKVQEGWSIARADYMITRPQREHIIVGIDLCLNDCQGLKWGSSANIPIWLPRQDQLQGMVIEKNAALSYAIHRFWQFIISDHNVNFFHSMEQLWLAFVMKEKFNKTWNGKEWVDNG